MADSAHEPLIRSSSEPSEFHDEDLNDVSLLLEKNLKHPGLFVYLLTVTAGITGLLFGYDTGVISATLVSIGSDLGEPLSTLDKSLITSATALFALLVSPVSGALADRMGRKRVVLLADVAFILGAVLQAIAHSVWAMIAGRSIVGLAVGAGSFVAPLYIAELSPAPFRGRLITMVILFITLGQVVAYILGWVFVEYGDGNGWRWLVGLGAVPAALQGGLMLIMPETPRWLVMVDRQDEARRVLNKVFGAGVDVQRMVDGVLKGVEDEVREEHEAKRGRMRDSRVKNASGWFADLQDTWHELFNVPGNRRALTIACLLQGLQQLCGFNSLMYFSATIFTLLGFASPTLTSLSVATTNFLLTCLALLLIDRVGRRRILLYSIPLMAFGLLLCAIGFHFITLPASLSLSPSTITSSTSPSEPDLSTRTAPLLVLASIMLYVASYALGLGNVPWMQSELFPLSIRSLGSGLSTSVNWGANFVVGLTFLPMMQALTPSWTFVVYAVVCVGGWYAIWRIYPETKGLSLEETGRLLERGWGVRESVVRAEELPVG